MNRNIGLAALLSACAIGAVSSAWAAPPPAMDSKALEAKFDAQINPAEMGTWLKLLAAEPNHVGSVHDKTNAEWIAAQLKSWGWDAKIEAFDVLYPTPISEALELVGGPGAPFKATLTEPPVPGDPATNTKDALPAYVAFQGDGDVTAPLVYVNYGMPEDYLALERMGVSVKGKIAIARYGGGWRGLKPLLAQMHGAAGSIIYSDPKDDGYATDDVYPKGAARPPQGFQRGSVADMPLYPGDPLTPGIGSTKGAKRIDRKDAVTILKIPCLPISYADAQVLLAALDGPVAPANFRGSLPITYHVGGGEAAKVHLAVKSDWSQKTIYDVVGTLKGSEAPNDWIVRGNHHDGWVMGASDPLSGQIALLAEAKAFGGLVKAGWKPKRTIVYTSWDAEEPMLLGSTEWAETHADELKAKAIVYINSDGNGRGFFRAEGSHDFQHFVNQVAADVKDPETGVSVAERARARLQVAASEPGANEQAKAAGKIVSDPGKDIPLGALGSGSDYSAFLQHLGLASIDFGYGGEGESGGVYHSLYDDYEHHSRFVDPGFAYDATLARTVGRAVMRLADTDLPVQRYGDFADTVAGYLDEVKKLADTRRDEGKTQARLLAGKAYALAADPTHPHVDPTPFAQSPALDFAALEGAVAKLKTSSKAFDTALAAKGEGLAKAQRVKLDAVIRPLDQILLRPEGLPGRPWYMNMVYAPGRFTGYGAKTLPGVREAIEERRFEDAQKYVGITAQALTDYAANLDKATAIVNGG
ncbi:transferrin receptor-like dimerization domain-containing protein [Phenylobacterium sp.]|jgi:N-acetylated-alpha-linked acidic dipeptidase|uniref:transferrin receptor-like dimerization domain-containing protein n=1 Tax=Phenylobacterium sp. TaxID=1871053 RepID=UPI002E310E84|nr:transferrin receptor-like dimerization domain-containing protein [Phenylobacterium sp.]HEX4710041.1 transferrin receptor-like dimerization domain-containing protein [Phenylobacterium sp.]